MPSSVPVEVHRYLSNGLEVYFQPVEGCQVFSAHLVVRAGSINEEAPHEVGMAHVLEHMLFKGTSQHPEPGAVARLVEEAGGDVNAYTTFDHTCYHITAPVSFLEQGVDLLLDMVQNSLLDEEELTRELEVIAEEIRRGQDSPGQRLSQSLFRATYAGTSWGRPIIGFEETIKTFRHENVMAFYKRWYVPNNMMLVVVGDGDLGALYRKLENQSSFLPRSLAPRAKEKPEDFSMEPKINLEFGSWHGARLSIGLEAPSLEDSQSALWDVFAHILGGAESSRLTRALQNDQGLVTSIDASCFTPKSQRGLLAIQLFAVGEKVPDAFRAIVEELGMLARTPPTSEEVKRVVQTIRAERIYRKEGVEGLARAAVYQLQTPQKLTFDDVYERLVSQVQSKDVQNIAGHVLKLFAQGRFAVSGVCQKDFEEAWGGAALGALLSERAAALLGQSSEASEHHETNALHTPTRRFVEWQISALNPQMKQTSLPLPGGRRLKVSVNLNKNLPLVSGVFVVRHQLEAKMSQAGLGNLLAQMLTRGTNRQSYQKFVEELEEHAASLSGFSTKDVLGLRFDALKENASRVLEMLGESFLTPAFLPHEYETVLRESKESLFAQKDQPSHLMSKSLQSLLYPNHAYGVPVLGTEESLAQMYLTDIQEFWARLFESDQYVLSLSGDVPIEEIVGRFYDRMCDALLKWPHVGSEVRREGVAEHQLRAPDHPKEFFAFTPLDRQQTHVALGFRAVSLFDDSRTSLELAVQVLAGQSGRLFLDLRDTRSLAYSVSASQQVHALGGAFLAYIATAHQKVTEALTGLKGHFEQLARTPPSSQELDRARQSVLGGLVLNQQYRSYQASQMALGDLFGVGFDHFLKTPGRVQSITADGLSQTLRRVMEQCPPLCALVGQPVSGDWQSDLRDQNIFAWQI